MQMTKKLFPSTFFYLISFGLTRFVSFLLIPLYTNVLSPSEFGNYSLLMATYAVLCVFFQAGLLQAFTGFYFNDNFPRKTVVSTFTYLLIGISLTLAIILTLFSSPVNSLLFSDGELTNLFVLICWILFIDNVSFFGMQLLKTEQKSGLVTCISAVSAIFNIALNFLFILHLNMGITGIILAQGFSSIIVLIGCSPSLLKYLTLSFDKKLMNEILRFAIPFMIAGIFGILMDVADRFLVDIYLDRESVGIYSLAYKIGLIMSIFVIAFRTAFLPFILNNKNDVRLPSTLQDIFLKFFALSLLIFLTVVLFIGDLSGIQVMGKYLINPAFTVGLHIVPFILIAYLFNGLAGFFSIAPYITGKSYHFIVSDLLGLGMNIILNIFLIPLYGLTGAAIATMFGFFLSAVYLYGVFSFTLSFKFPVGKMLPVILALLLSVLCIYYIDTLFIRVVILIFYFIVSVVVIKPLRKGSLISGC